MSENTVDTSNSDSLTDFINMKGSSKRSARSMTTTELYEMALILERDDKKTNIRSLLNWLANKWRAITWRL